MTTGAFGWVHLANVTVREVKDAILGQNVRWGTPGIDDEEGRVVAVQIHESGTWSAVVEDLDSLNITLVPFASIYEARPEKQ